MMSIIAKVKDKNFFYLRIFRSKALTVCQNYALAMAGQ